MPVIEAAITREQNVEFAVVAVKQSAMQLHNRDQTQLEFQSYFPGRPIVLMSQVGQGIPTYYGRNDIVKFLSGVLVEQLPWKRYTFTE